MLEERVDGGVEGAFGEVWKVRETKPTGRCKCFVIVVTPTYARVLLTVCNLRPCPQAQWDGITVAVKVMKTKLLAFNPNIVQEFDKEVEFMQKTRHTNIVRFFGMGRFPDDTPFLVEELLTGSLQAVLYGSNKVQCGGRAVYSHDVVLAFGPVRSRFAAPMTFLQVTLFAQWRELIDRAKL